MVIFSAANTSISGLVIAIGVFLKSWLKDKKIKNFELNRILPILLLFISEIISVVYGSTRGEDIWTSLSNGVVSALTATYGYDVVKTAMSNGIKNI